MEPTRLTEPTLRTSLVSDPAALTAEWAAWDDLAETCGQPYAAPDWCMAWWRHVAPRTSQLRIVLVHDDDALVGVAPFCCQSTRLGPVRYRILGADTSPRVEPLARPGREQEVARSIASALAEARPRADIIEFDGVRVDTSWPELVAGAWPRGRPRVERTAPTIAPAITLDGDFDEWLGGKSRNFRQQARRHRRRLVDRGATFRVPRDAGEAVARLADFARLHEARWRYRGGSGVIDAGVMKMLREAANRMAPSGRFQLHLIEQGQEVVAAHVFLATGTEMTYWLGGFDEQWAADQPSMQALIDAVARGLDEGRRRLDLGPGSQSYKERLSDHEQKLVSARVYPPGPARPLAVATRWPERLRDAMKRKFYAALSTRRKDQVKRLLRRARG